MSFLQYVKQKELEEFTGNQNNDNYALKKLK